MTFTSRKTTKVTAGIAVCLTMAAPIVLTACKPQNTLPPAARAEDAWLDAKARESGGDINRLTPADQQEMRSKMGPQAEWLLKNRAKMLTAGAHP